MEADPARRNLEAERDRLKHVQESLESDHLHDESEEESAAGLAHMVLQHPADVGSDAFEREKDFSILDQVQAELDDVALALERLDAGTYGTCQSCGSKIDDDRLAAVPATRFCVDHQGDLET